MVETDNCKDRELGNPRISPIFIPKFGPDRFSDLIASIIINKLVDFTILCAEIFRLPLSSQRKRVHKKILGYRFRRTTNLPNLARYDRLREDSPSDQEVDRILNNLDEKSSINTP